MERQKLRILIVQPHLSIYGGAETVVVKLAQCLKKKNIEVDIMALTLSNEIASLFKDLKFITPENKCQEKVRSVSFWKALGVINETRVLKKLLHKHARNYDIINIHNFPATWAAVNIHKPTVWMCNEPPDLYCNPRPSVPLRLLRCTGFVVDKYIVNKYMNTICVADNYNANRAYQRYQRETEIVHYGIDYDFFSKSDSNQIKKNYDLSNSYVLLQVGVLSPEKNQLESIKAVEVLKNSIPNLKLVLAGKGTNTYEEDLKKYIRTKNLDDSVIFTGLISKEEVRDLYHLCNVALFPVKSQGGWLSPFEALSAGKPIIVSSTIGAAELIKKEKIGIVTEDFQKAIKDVYSQSEKYGEITEKGKKWVANNLTWDIFTQKMLDIFNKQKELQ